MQSAHWASAVKRSRRSSVTRIDLFTRQAGSIASLHLHLEAGEIQTNEIAGCRKAQQSLCATCSSTPAAYEVPQKDFTEAGYILAWCSMPRSPIRKSLSRLIRDGSRYFTDRKGKLLAPVFSVFGKEMTANMIKKCRKPSATV